MDTKMGQDASGGPPNTGDRPPGRGWWRCSPATKVAPENRAVF